MVQFFQEIQEQPQALLQTANFYKSVEGKSVLSQISDGVPANIEIFC